MKGISFAILTVLLMVTGLRAAEVEVLKPKGNLEIKLGHPSTISLYDMPAVLTHERLNKNGWNVKSVEFTRTDLNVQALAQGTIQIANSQVMDPVRAIQKGAKLSFVMENNGGEFLMIAKNEIKDCKDTDGKRFAIHGEAATTSLAAKLWLLNDCKVKPNIMVIPGGEMDRIFKPPFLRPESYRSQVFFPKPKIGNGSRLLTTASIIQDVLSSYP